MFNKRSIYICYCEIISVTATLLHFFGPTACRISVNRTKENDTLLIFVTHLVTFGNKTVTEMGYVIGVFSYVDVS